MLSVVLPQIGGTSLVHKFHLWPGALLKTGVVAVEADIDQDLAVVFEN
jgi:hypothetical protein